MDTNFREMVRQTNIALRNMKFYAADHPSTTNSLQRSYDALMKMLAAEGQLTLGVVDNTLILNDSPIEESDRFISDLTEELTVRNIESLVFYPDLSPDELRVLLDCLNREPDRLLTDGGAQKFLDVQGVTHITANEVKYGKINESSGEGGLEESIIAAFLMGKTPVFRGDQEGLLSLVEESPGKIGDIINTRFSHMVENGEGEEKSGRAANRAMEQVGRFLETQPEDSVDRSAVMTQIMLSLSPEVHAGLYGYRVAHENSPHDRIDELVGEFKNEEVIRLICSNKEWTRSYSIKVNLVNNAKTPLSEALRFMNHLRDKDLQSVARSKNIPAPVATSARKLLQKRAEKGKAKRGGH